MLSAYYCAYAKDDSGSIESFIASALFVSHSLEDAKILASNEIYRRGIVDECKVFSVVPFNAELIENLGTPGVVFYCLPNAPQVGELQNLPPNTEYLN